MPINAQAPIPVHDPVVTLPESQRERGKLSYGMPTRSWIEFFAELQRTASGSTTVVSRFDTSGQSVSIGLTDISGGLLPDALYLFRYYMAVTTAAGTSSSLTMLFDWVDDLVVKSWTSTAMTGNTVSTTQSGQIMFHSDAQSPIRFGTSFASVGTPVMIYKIWVVLEKVGS